VTQHNRCVLIDNYVNIHEIVRVLSHYGYHFITEQENQSAEGTEYSLLS